MSNEKKREEERVLNSRADVQKALSEVEYQPSQSVADAEQALKNWQEQKPDSYQSRYQSQMDDLMEQLLGRESFGYHYAQDPLYRQYEQAYSQNAANASADAAAQASALTGGYGSSYAASVAQQAYQQQMGALNEAIPTLYRLALETYTGEGDALEEKLEQLDAREQSDRAQYQQELADYYDQLEQKGEAYNTAYAQDYARYQDELSQLNTLYGYYAAQEQEAASRKQQRFNQVMSVLGLLGDAVQLAISGTTGLGSLVGSLANTGYNIKAGERAYEASRADAAWAQQMQQLQRQDSLDQQQYKNEQAQQQYQDALRQQQFENRVTAEKLEMARSEWAQKQEKAEKSVQQASTAATSRAASGTAAAAAGNTAAKASVIPYSAARLRSQGRSDMAIRSQLLREGYSSEEIRDILRQMN